MPKFMLDFLNSLTKEQKQELLNYIDTEVNPFDLEDTIIDICEAN